MSLGRRCSIPYPASIGTTGRMGSKLRDMSTAFDVRALSSMVRIELDDSLSTADQESIKSQWVDLAHDSAGEPDRVIRASVDAPADPLDGSFVIHADSPEALAQRITSEVTVGAMRGLRGGALMLHAS